MKISSNFEHYTSRDLFVSLHIMYKIAKLIRMISFNNLYHMKMHIKFSTVSD